MVNFIKLALIFLNIFAVFVSTSDATENENKENNYPFVKLGHKYYYVNTFLKMNWFESYDFCRSIGGDLVHIESTEELLVLQKYVFEENIRSQLWTDGNDLATEGRYMSHTTGRPLVFIKWKKNNPDNLNNEDCIEVCVDVYDKILLMNDNDCYRKFYAICQYRAPNVYSIAKTSLMSSNTNCMLRNLAEAFIQAADMCDSCAQSILQPTA